MSKPIKPSDIVEAKSGIIPDEVIDSFNELIAKNWNGLHAVVYQNDVVALIQSKMKISEEGSNRIYVHNWLDVEDIYEKVGWKVYYCKPAYFETYEPYFTFSRI